MNDLINISAQFQLPGKVLAIEPHGRGNINDTFVVHLATEQPKKCILQRINREVFPRPELIMENIRILTDHLRDELKKEAGTSAGDWRLLELYPTREGADFLLAGSSCWRMMNFIEQAVSPEKIKDSNHAHEIGRGLGRFHYLLRTLRADKLHDTLPGFHITPQYLKIYDDLPKQTEENGPEAVFCREFIERHRDLAYVLERAKAKMPVRIIHGDPKINNIMMDRLSGRVACLIDLDTVKPGLVLYDIGDCLRSCCNSEGEDIAEPEKIFFDLNLCLTILTGYFSEAEKFITPVEHDHIFQAINLIPFELGLRFFTDFLKGSVYFKTSDPIQNLRRALGQFYLTRSIERQEKEIRGIIAGFRD